MPSLADLSPHDETALATVRDAVAAGLDVHGDEVLGLAQRAASFDERTAYRENGRPVEGRVGGGARCAEVLTQLIAAGLPHPGSLLRYVRWPDAARVVLALVPSQADIDAGLLAQCDEYSFDPSAEVVSLLLAAKPSQAALDTGFLRACKGAARYRGVPVELAFYDIFDAFLAAGARADHTAAPDTSAAIHHLTTFSLPDVVGGSRSKTRNARAVATFTHALRNVTTIDLRAELGMTPLHAACHHGAHDRIPLLLAAGADPELRTDEGQLPADLAHHNPAVYAALGVAPPLPPPPRAKLRPKAPAAPPPPDPLRVSIRVRHAKFGFGEVTAVNGEGDKRKLTIRFDDGETKVLGASFVTPL